METITLKSHVGEDGILKLELPVQTKDADVEVKVTLEPVGPKDKNGWPTGYFEKTFGSIKDKTFVRPNSGDCS